MRTIPKPLVIREFIDLKFELKVDIYRMKKRRRELVPRKAKLTIYSGKPVSFKVKDGGYLPESKRKG